MLYQLVEAQRGALEPWRMAAGIASALLAPAGVWSAMPLSREFAASNGLFLRLTKRYPKPAWNLKGAEPVVVQQKPFCNLVHLRQASSKPRKVLLVAPLSGHH